VYTSDVIPSTINEYLPPKLASKSSGYNYLGNDKPLYLLSESVIYFNASIKSSDNDINIGCIYLFNTSSEYTDFVHGSSHSPPSYNDRHCFPPMKGSFNITQQGQYFVSFHPMEDEISMTISVTRIRYNTTGLKSQDCYYDICSNSTICQLPNASYVIVHSNNSTCQLSSCMPILAYLCQDVPLITLSATTFILIFGSLAYLLSIISCILWMCLCRDDTNNQGYSPLINNRSELHPWPYIEDNSISRSSTPDPKLPENSSPRIENSKGTEQTDTSSAGDCRNSSSLGSENIKIHNTTSDSKYGLNSGNENKGEVIQHDNTSGSDSGLGYSSAGNVDRRRVIQPDTTSGSDSGYCSSDVNVNRRIVQHDTTNGRPKLKSCVELYSMILPVVAIQDIVVLM
jgi:hypothetical protein